MVGPSAFPMIINHQASKNIDDGELLWEGFLESWEEPSLYSQILLREDYLKRIKEKFLPLVKTQAKSDLQNKAYRDGLNHIDLDSFAHIFDLYREATISVVENIKLFQINQNGKPFIWKGINYLLKLPSDTVIYPGHNYGYSSTISIKENISLSPFFQCKNLEEFIKVMDNFEENR